MKQRIVNTICALVIVAGIVITSTDGIIALFGFAHFWQYLFNFAFICVIVPLCIAASDISERVQPELFGEEVQL